MVSRYFAYGSNMHPDQVGAWCRDAQPVGPARLDGFRLDFRRHSIRWNAGVADVVASPAGSVWGVLYELPHDDLAALDRKEGVPSGAYERIDVTVRQGTRMLDAITYSVVDKSPEPIPPNAEYALLLLEASARCGLPASYRRDLQSMLEAVAAPR